MVRCTVCEENFNKNDFYSLAKHFIEFSELSDSSHISWLNRNLTKNKVEVEDLEKLFKTFFDYSSVGLNRWIKITFIKKFYGENLHPFVEKLQNPSRATILGYVLEHQHFLTQWVRSCAFILAKSGKEDVINYEYDNIQSEWGGHKSCGLIPHYELLIRMGESQGLTRETILSSTPLEETKKAIEFWNHIANNYHWVETMLAMHGLELIANRNLRNEGAKKHYFDPKILESREITDETKEFLREGYEADVHHAEEAIKLVEKYSVEYDIVDDVQSTFLKSIEVFDNYLMSRLERAEKFETQ
ncbi:MAG: thiaminase II/PqqC family protein [Candidatus Hodarchaeales archaeon]